MATVPAIAAMHYWKMTRYTESPDAKPSRSPEFGRELSARPDIVETIRNIGIYCGNTRAQTNAVMSRLGRALDTGSVGLDEYRAVMENLPGVWREVAYDYAVTVGQLRKIAHDGNLTTEEVFGALERCANKAAEDAAKVPRPPWSDWR